MSDERNDVLASLIASPVEYRGERVVTLRQVDEVHELAEGTAQRAFGRHREELQDGVHFHRMASGSGGQIVRPIGTPKGGGSDLVVLTERGYLWLATTFRGPLAARVRDRLVEAYFAIRQAASGTPTDRVLERVLSLAESIQADRSEYRADRLEDRRLMAALVARVDSAVGDYIGRDRGTIVNNALTEWAKAQARSAGRPDDWSPFRRSRENSIREDLEFSGPGTPWWKYPRTDWVRLEREVIRLRTEAERVSPQSSFGFDS